MVNSTTSSGLLRNTARIASVSGEAGLMPSCASSVSSSRSRPMRAPLPWSPTRKPQPPIALRHAVAPRHIGGAGAEDRHRAVALADRAFQRDQRVGLDAAPGEGQDRFELLRGRCRHCCRQGRARHRFRGIRAGSRPASRKACRAASTMFSRAPVRSVRMLAGPLLPRPTDAAGSGRKRRPATRAAAIDAEHKDQRTVLREWIIPIKYQ